MDVVIVLTMSVAERRVDRAVRSANQIHARLGEEVRTLRRMAGLSQQQLAVAAGLSQSVISELEHGAATGAPIETFTRVLTILGARLSVRVYPEGPPIRDAAHVALLARLRGRLPPIVRMRTEVPLGIPGDLRAWDAVLGFPTRDVPVEGETVLHDLQAVDRRIALKLQDSGKDVVILLVSDTVRNRAVLRAAGEQFQTRFPMGTRAALAAIGRGVPPTTSALIVL